MLPCMLPGMLPGMLLRVVPGVVENVMPNGRRDVSRGAASAVTAGDSGCSRLTVPCSRG
jgi:hypothetical protein